MPHRNIRGPAIVGHDPAPAGESDSALMREVLASARAVAKTRSTVLLTGETGVGKGVVARLIHHWSSRRTHPFVLVHCGAIPDTLLESELFGHERGAFTGAERRTQGKFELAGGGTLFLDEVGTISPAAQVKLLDAVQELRFRRVGGDEEISVDVRIIAASNADLSRLQREGAFRADLYHRLNRFPIEIPPLRKRMEDLPRLASQILERLNSLYSKRIEGLDALVERAFLAYAWPGNIRELENVLERAHTLETGAVISPASIPLEILRAAGPSLGLAQHGLGTLAQAREEAIHASEHAYLLGLLSAHQGRMESAARAAGISARHLRKLLAKHGLQREDFKRRNGEKSEEKSEEKSGKSGGG